MSNYRKRRSYPGNSSPPRKKRNTGKKFLKGIAITLAVIACISLVAGLLPNRHADDKPTEPVKGNVSYSWDERSYYWPIDRTVEDGYLTITQSQGSGDTTSNCQQFFVTAAEGDSAFLPEWTDYTVETNFKLANYGARTDFSIMGRLQRIDDGGFTYYQIVFRSDLEKVVLRKITQRSWGSKTATVLATSDPVFTREEFHNVKVSFAGDTITVFVDDLATPILVYKDVDPLVSGSVGIDLARLGIATVDYIKVCDSDNVLFIDDFTDARYFPADSSEATE